jgi:hypothetical protein
MAAVASMSLSLKGFNAKEQIAVKPEEYVIAKSEMTIIQDITKDAHTVEANHRRSSLRITI